MLTEGHTWGDDFASYLMQARSIVDGSVDDFLDRNTFTIDNSLPGLGPVAYPWGYPLLLAPLVALLGLNLLAFKLLNLFFFILFLLSLYYLVKDRLSRLETFLLLALFAVHPAYLSIQNEILSDIPFLFFSTFSLLLIDRYNAESAISMSIRRGIGMGLAIFFSSAIRTNGFLLLAVLFLSQFINFLRLRQKDSLPPIKSLLSGFTPYAVFLISWLILQLVLPGGGSAYFSQITLSNLPEIIMKNLQVYFLEILPAFFNPIPGARVIFWVLMVLAVIGSISRLKRDAVITLYCILTLGLYFAWPAAQVFRFLIPIFPFFIYFIFTGLAHIFGLHARLHVVAVSVIGCLFIGFFLSSSLPISRQNLARQRQINGPYDAVSSQVFDFLTTNTPAESVVGFFKPRVLRLETNRDAFTALSCEQVWAIDRQPIYLVTHLKMGGINQIRPNKIDECADHGYRVELVFSNEKFTVHELTHTP